ncbi:acetoacetate--CoA ligase [Cumulibacter manganitolerans]|uniref:acetoacetate--CoA ligase n=1 Tax=Cumulibacter manganitolerans TaxID=1884992 RepID=UPI0012977167|nr:acetoacetate--CoA ligase [Cumulibacter manganitolerans]
MSTPAGTLLHEPAPADLERSALGGFVRWLAGSRGLSFDSYEALHRWSVDDLEGFWRAIVEYFDVRYDGSPEPVLVERTMPGARWFPHLRLNYAEHLLRRGDDGVAAYGYSQTRAPIRLTHRALRAQVAAAQAALRSLGVGRGDRVVGYLPNVPETLVAYAATISLGAIWAGCAPEFGAQSVIDRFGQVEPAVLLAVSGYTYGAREVDRRDEVARIRAAIPSVQHVVEVEYGAHPLPDAQRWSQLLERHATTAPPTFTRVPFEHPMVVLFSSGTTGRPKAIVHGHGGLLVEHLKSNALSWDITAEDTFLWFSTTAWMMWNSLSSALLNGASIVMIDGNPAHPGLDWQFRIAAETATTIIGLSPAFIAECRRQDVRPGALGVRVKEVCAAGSPMSPDAARWVYDELGPQVLLNVGCGGTDVCSGIVQGSPWQAVWAGEISGRCLGVAATAYDERGHEVIGELGELVITEPMPSMPVAFWGDPDGTRLREAYFESYPGIWRHGDWIRFTDRGSCVVSGRSDATLNRGGVRLGTADFYSTTDRIPEIADAMVIHLEDDEGGMGTLWLFVVPAEGVELDDALRARIADRLRTDLSPRHVPDRIEAVPAIPHNRTGKKLEVPVKKILKGRPVDEVASKDALADPTSLDAFVTIRERMEQR